RRYAVPRVSSPRPLWSPQKKWSRPWFLSSSSGGLPEMTNGMLNSTVLPTKSYARIPNVHPLPTLIEVQLKSFEWFRSEGLRELLDEISPITSFNKNLELYFLDYRFDESKYNEAEC